MPDLNHYIAALVDEPTADRLDAAAREERRSRSFIVREAIGEFLDRRAGDDAGRPLAAA